MHTALSACHTASGRQDFETETFLVEAIAFNARQDPISGPVAGPLDTDPSTQAIAFSVRGREGGAMAEVDQTGAVPALRAADGGSTRPFMAFDETQSTSPTNRVNVAQSVTGEGRASARGGDVIQSAATVRRITITEAERLQGFPDHETLIHWPRAHRKSDDLAETVAYLRSHGFSEEEAHVLAQTPDGPRYRALGNSWPVAVARWIGERIAVARATVSDEERAA